MFERDIYVYMRYVHIFVCTEFTLKLINRSTAAQWKELYLVLCNVDETFYENSDTTDFCEILTLRIGH